MSQGTDKFGTEMIMAVLHICAGEAEAVLVALPEAWGLEGGIVTEMAVGEAEEAGGPILQLASEAALESTTP